MVRARLGERGHAVELEAADVRSWRPRRAYGAWHDRAVFHFLVQPADRETYVATATVAVQPGGVIALGTFAADGPAQYSGLPTSRYEPEALAAIFDSAFALEHAEREEHMTPVGVVQPFSWVVLRRAQR